MKNDELIMKNEKRSEWEKMKNDELIIKNEKEVSGKK